MLPSPDFQLFHDLRARKEAEGGYSALERAIKKANQANRTRDPEAKTTIDRRKLKSLVEGDASVALSAAEFRILDCYLEPLGYGLAWRPLFQRPHVVRLLADSAHVVFLFGEKRAKDGEREIGYFSNSDVLGMAAVQREIGLARQYVLFDPQPVLLHESPTEAWECADRGDWTLHLREHLGEKGPSVVVLGTYRSCLASEGVLCRMGNCGFFIDAALKAKLRLPFHFVWSENLPDVFDSYFRLKPADIRERDPEAAAAVEAGDASALVTKEKIYVDSLHRAQSGKTYGVCVAQRRADGQLWLVLAGVTGAATLAAARVAPELVTEFHRDPPGQHSAVYWGVVEAVVHEDPKGSPGIGRIASAKIITGPQRWVPKA